MTQIGTPVFRGDKFAVTYRASKAPTSDLLGTLWYREFGSTRIQRRQIREAVLDFTSNRSAVTKIDPAIVLKDGEVMGLEVTGFADMKRGQFFARASISLGSVQERSLASGYIYHNRSLALGDREEPIEGKGFIHKNAIADDVTPVDIEHTLGVTAALRRIDGFIWYYHCSSDVANRTLRVSARDFGEGLPTGMTSGGNTLNQVFPSAGVLTLSANEEGMIYVSAQNGSRISVSLDNGVKTTEDTSVAQPLPFPYWASEADVGELFFDVQLAEAADRHSIYIIEEEWIEA